MNLLDRAKGIISNPKEEWNTIKSETTSNNDLITQYAVPLIIAGALASVVGHFIQGYSGVAYIITTGVVSIAVQIVMILVASYVIFALAETFDSKKDLNAAMKLVVYANTASYLAAIVANLHLYLSWVGLFGLYGIYLFWTGLSIIMETPEGKKLPYTIMAAILIIIVGVVSGSIVGLIVGLFSFLWA